MGSTACSAILFYSFIFRWNLENLGTSAEVDTIKLKALIENGLAEAPRIGTAPACCSPPLL
eukprot:scaffold85603_cov17-Tisochrysis_lutea.AAC.1